MKTPTGLRHRWISLAASVFVVAATAAPLPTTWPQECAVRRDRGAGRLVVSTPYYAFEQDLKHGGVISRIALANGRASNLVQSPLSFRLRDERGAIFTDLADASPKVKHRLEDGNVIVNVESELKDLHGRGSGLRLRSRYEYRWGYVKLHRELLAPSGRFAATELRVLDTVLAPSLTHYGYREGTTEEEGAPPFSFGSNRWGQLRSGQPDLLETGFVPRSMMFADPGVEGIEWFAGSDLAQWDLQLTGRRGQGRCAVQPSLEPAGWALCLAPLHLTNGTAVLPKSAVFDCFLGVPISDGRARRPWLHTSFNRNRGNWVSPEEIARWKEKGMQTAHCHNDGDYYSDGLFWRDGSYPPYPDMDRFDQVLRDCRRAGIRTATYFSNKELHPDTPAYQEHGAEWSRQNRRGAQQHNFFKANSEFGAQMCLRSGWLPFLKSSIDRVLRNHPLDGVYYDWNVALFCCNPRHEKLRGTNAPAAGHWDIEELLDLMEWTRRRVGPHGLVIVHNTTTPLFAAENFADDVVATEWGYGKWKDRAPDLEALPLEWSLTGARSRGVISYGTLDAQAPRRLHRLFALEALLGGVTPWPASPEAFDLLPLLSPIGDIESCKFADWRNPAVRLSDPRCGAAVYSRPGEAYLLLANLEAQPRTITCVLSAGKLPCPLREPSAAAVVASSPSVPAPEIEVKRLLGEGVQLTLPGDGALLIRVR